MNVHEAAKRMNSLVDEVRRLREIERDYERMRQAIRGRAKSGTDLAIELIKLAVQGVPGGREVLADALMDQNIILESAGSDAVILTSCEERQEPVHFKGVQSCPTKNAEHTTVNKSEVTCPYCMASWDFRTSHQPVRPQRTGRRGLQPIRRSQV